VNRISLGVALAALGLAAGEAPAQAGWIEGTLVISPTLAVRKPRLRPYSDYGPGSLPRSASPESNEFVNVVVYLDTAPPAAEPVDVPLRTLAIAQRNETFVPHVLAVLAGSTVQFPNADPVFHNVFSLSSARSFDLGRYPRGASKSVRFDKRGIVQVFCHIHSDMSAIVLVLGNPFFAVPDAAGRYRLDGVPPGDYRLVVWHERIKPVVRRVRVAPGQSATADFDIPLPGGTSRP
jgi:plastocyanin